MSRTHCALKIRKAPKAEIKKKVKEMLELVQLEGYEKRKPSELSGGQKQRVAIARALANNPRVLLLDEPLGALDLQLRRTMQLELKRLQKKLGITFIYITHDQEEAINMSDRIVVMNQGQFEQIGTPDEIYNHPKTGYVAAFVGNANILKGTVAEKNGHHIKVKLGDELASIDTEEKVNMGETVTVALRSENILLEENGGLHATVKEKNFAAGQLRVLLTLPNGYSLLCKWFRAAVLPADRLLYAELYQTGDKKKCTECGAFFASTSNSVKYCPVCRKRITRRQAAERMRKRRTPVTQ